ncbi:MAG: translation elongation factor Ts [Saprospiraceae bacterium]|jgi:elongation factor Ts|nr:translation elongation factor Ts [Saprospiraceae bacterium]MDP4821160.1 translation elongation factor Ts [Saprospiraceae bacterium]MDP4999768.1 translation elongation factor Ts [Saprospiraceae bacterium]
MSEVNISASDVKKLRDMTGAGMMDCKKALSEAGGDFDKAIEELRKRGQKLSTKRADRDAKEGVVVAMVSDDKSKGIVLRLSCETDFVAKNESFIELTKRFAQIALDNMPESSEALLALPFDGITIGDKVAEQTGVIGEKIEISSYEKLEAALVCPYIHMGYRAGVLIGLNKDAAGAFDAGRDVAMQVAAMRPVAVDKDDVDHTTIEKEIEIGKEQARQEGKPEAMLEKIALGKLQKFFKESTLLNQDYVKDNKMSVSQYLKSIDKELTVTAFRHVELG